MRQVRVTITINWNRMTITDNYTTIIAQIKIRRKSSLCGPYVRTGTSVHIPLCIWSWSSRPKECASRPQCPSELERSLLKRSVAVWSQEFQCSDAAANLANWEVPKV